MKKFFGILFCLILFFFATSCKKNNDSTPPNNTDNTALAGDSILHFVKRNGIIINEYLYNSNHSVKTLLKYDDDGTLSYTCNFIYNNLSRLVRINNLFTNATYNSYDTCIYITENRLSRIYNYMGAVQNYTQIFQYDILNRLNHFDMAYGGGVYGTNYIYGNGNNISKEYDSGDLVKDTTYYVYDTNKSFKIKNAPRMATAEVSVNNIIQQIHNDENGVVKPTDSYNSVFEYNANTLPTFETRSYLSSYVVYYEYIYY